MKTQQKPLAAHLGRCLCGSAFMILAVAAAWQLRPDWFHCLPRIKSGSSPAGHVRNRNPAELITKIDERLAAEHMRISAIEESLIQLRNLRNSLNFQVDNQQQSLSDRRQELQQYAELVNQDEGLILASGEYVSATAVRNRAVQRRAQFEELHRQVDPQLRMVSNIGDSLEMAESQLSIRQREVHQLQELRDGLAEKTIVLARLEATTTGGDKSESSMASLRAAVESMHDIIDVRLDMLEEESEIEQALGLVTKEDSSTLFDQEVHADD